GYLQVLPAAVPAADDLGHGVDEVLLPRACLHRLILSVNAENLDVHRLAIFLNVNYLNAHGTCGESDEAMDVIAAGGGPAGLVTAALLDVAGLGVEVCERRSEPTRQSRGTAMHRRGA